MTSGRSERRPRTAAELMAELEQDSGYQTFVEEVKQEKQLRQEDYQRAAEPVLAELAGAGFPVDTIGELRQRGVDYRRAVPILLHWLPTMSDRSVKLDIIHALGSKWARPAAARPLAEEFLRTVPDHDPPGDSVRWAIGDALEVVADESVLDELLGLATDRQHGSERGFVVVALGNMARMRERVVPVLLDLLDDDDVAGYAVMALGKLQVQEARPAVERFLEHPASWVRKEAKKALSKIGPG